MLWIWVIGSLFVIYVRCMWTCGENPSKILDVVNVGHWIDFCDICSVCVNKWWKTINILEYGHWIVFLNICMACVDILFLNIIRKYLMLWMRITNVESWDEGMLKIYFPQNVDQQYFVKDFVKHFDIIDISDILRFSIRKFWLLWMRTTDKKYILQLYIILCL